MEVGMRWEALGKKELAKTDLDMKVFVVVSGEMSGSLELDLCQNEIGYEEL